MYFKLEHDVFWTLTRSFLCLNLTRPQAVFSEMYLGESHKCDSVCMEFQWKWRCVSALAEQSALILGHSQIKNQEWQSQYVWWLTINHLPTEEVVLVAEVLTLHCDMLFFIYVTAFLYSQALSPITLWQWNTALWMEWPLHPLFSWHLVFSTFVT